MATLSSDDILSNARALVPEIGQRSDEIAAARKLPRDLVEKLRAAGVFRIMMPKSWGGPEMSLPQQIELNELLSEADASVGWCVKIGADSGAIAAFLPEHAARELYPSLDLISGGQAPPNGRAIKVDGGYRVSGRWGFASGITHADVVVSGCTRFENGQPVPGARAGFLAVAPASCFRIEDTWLAHGLAGSGSTHYSAENLFVPDGHHIDLIGARSWCDGPLYRTIPGLLFVVPMAGTALGVARHAIDAACAVAQEGRIPVPPPPTPVKDLARVRLAVGQAETMYGAARAFVYDSVGRFWAELEAGRQPTLKIARDVFLARINAFRMAVGVTRLMYDTIGARAVYQSCPIERLMRDAATINQHLGLNDGMVEQWGLSLLGGTPAISIS